MREERTRSGGVFIDKMSSIAPLALTRIERDPTKVPNTQCDRDACSVMRLILYDPPYHFHRGSGGV